MLYDAAGTKVKRLMVAKGGLHGAELIFDSAPVRTRLGRQIVAFIREQTR